MKLYLLRHGEAVERGESYKEADRPLTPKGIQRTKALVHALRQMEISLDAIFSSPLTRALQTAQLVERGLRLAGKLALTEDLKPSGSMEKLIGRLAAVRPAPESVLLVGHEPYLSGLVSLLCTGGTGLLLTLKKGGLCRLEVELLACGRCASLEWLVAPRLIGFKSPRRS